jgi:hypothetical protein
LVDVVHDWGCKPSEFGLCEEKDDLTVMAAFTSAVTKMREWESQQAKKKE